MNTYSEQWAAALGKLFAPAATAETPPPDIFVGPIYFPPEGVLRMSTMALLASKMAFIFPNSPAGSNA